MEQRIKVLQVVGAMDIGGVETWLMRILRRIDRKHFVFDFCCLSGKPGIFAPEIESLGGRVLPFRLSRNIVSFQRRFGALLRGGGYQVVHSHVHYFSGTILRSAQKEGIPVRIAHSHTTVDDRKSTVFRKTYRVLQRRWISQMATAAIGASSQAALSLFGPDWSAIPGAQIIRCGIDLNLFNRPVNRAALRQSLGLPEESRVIGYVGRFDREKNCGFLLEVFKEALSGNPDLRLLMVGDGPLRPEIEQRIAEIGIFSQVVLAGWRSDVAELMAGAMDLFCLPSLFEGLGIAALEAQAAGLPCLISTDVPPEVDIVPGSVSFLPRSAGAAAWAETITRKIKEPRIDPSLAHRAIRDKGFDLETSFNSLTGLYGRTDSEKEVSGYGTD